jgi:uncharacterized membrane-anchored protein YitT (DUF2179 family)
MVLFHFQTCHPCFFIVLSKDALFHFGLIYIGKAFSSIELTRVEPMTKLQRSFQAFPANIRLVRMWLTENTLAYYVTGGIFYDTEVSLSNIQVRLK